MPNDDSNLRRCTPAKGSTPANGLDHLRITGTYSTVHKLSDGTMTRVRLLRPDDGDWVRAGFAELGEESRYRRFFTAMPRLPDGFLQRLLDVDAWNHLAIAAEAAVQPPTMPQPFGIARFVRLEENADTAEAAVAVVDHMQGRGLGKLLLSVLAAAARERGVKHFRAEVLNSNDAMRALLRELDRDLEPLAVDGGTATYDIALPEIAAHESVSRPLLHFLKTAARGIELRLQQLRDGR